MVCLTMVFFFIRCYKEPTYEVLVKCYYSVNGVEKGDPVPWCRIDIGDENRVSPLGNFADPNQLRKEVFTDANGQYKTTFRYEALLDVRAEAVDIDSIKYFGRGEVKLIPNEVATLEILLVKE